MSSHLTFKVLVVGDEDVGKTTIVNHYTLMPVCFSGSTVGIEFQSRMVALSADALHDNLIISENSSKNASETGTDTPRLLKISSTTSTMGLQERIKHYDHVKCYFGTRRVRRVIIAFHSLITEIFRQPLSFLICQMKNLYRFILLHSSHNTKKYLHSQTSDSRYWK